MLFHPANNDHALIEVVFEITFEKPFSKAAEKAFETSSALKQRLPGLEYGASLTVEISQTGEGQARTHAQWANIRRSRYREDGNIVRSAGLNRNVLHINMLDYNGWDSVWRDVEKTLFEAMEAGVLDHENKVTNVGLQLVNEFIASEDNLPLDFSKLFTSSGMYVPTAVIRDGFPFQQKSVFRAALDAQHKHFVDTTIDIISGFDPKIRRSGLRAHLSHIVSITHDNSTNEYLKNGVANSFDVLRWKNHEVLRNMLTAEMCDRIGALQLPSGSAA